MKPNNLSLQDWLSLIESRHPKEIDMGLMRVEQVKRNLNTSFRCPVIMVAGTNGKGSTCAMLESIFLSAGYQVGLYSKPHFLDFNERVRVNGNSVTDQELTDAFSKVETCRSTVSLTYFEFTTLAICEILANKNLDVVILEVGLGGRLDAVNVFDADVAIVTSIDIDHKDYLGDTREQIGFEKAGIFRSNKTAICSDPFAPQSLIEHAQTIGCDLWLFGRDFNYSGDNQQWNYGGRELRRNSLNYPSLRGANQLLNASGVLACLEVLREKLPVNAQDIRSGLATVELPGRFQVIPGKPQLVFDVAHNPHATAALAQNLSNMSFYPYTHAIFGCMKDKDIDGILTHMINQVDHWYLCDLPGQRAASALELKNILIQKGVLNDPEKTINTFVAPEDAYKFAMSNTSENDRIVVFGSFLTVAGAMRVRQKK